MKICGIIAEYNPFHEGHAYHLREAKRLSGADAVAVIMSGHFVQRGEPAIFDPYTRAEAALKSGADAVFMMPPEASTASAEGFAMYGAGVLDALGCDYISCGTESGIEGVNIEGVADRLADEDEDTAETIREKLKSGMSYPAAMAAAVGGISFGPNTILAIEYLKAMKRIGSSMEFIPVERVGSGYNDTEIKEGEYPSATAIRRRLLRINEKSGAECRDLNSDTVSPVIAGSFPIGPDDVMPMIIESIRNHMDELEDFADCSPEIASRIRNSRLHYKSFEEMVTDIKTKDVTYTRIARVLTHILLGVRKNVAAGRIMPQKSDHVVVHTLDTIKYAQLIGFSNTQVLTELKQRNAQRNAHKNENFVIISKAADYKDMLKSSAYAAEIYNQALWNKYHVEGKEFFRQKILKI